MIAAYRHQVKIARILVATAIMWFGLQPMSAQTWVQSSAPATNWQSVAFSADGKKLIAVVSTHLAGFTTNGSFVPGPIYISTNSGTTWTQTSAPEDVWFFAASSADGTKLAAVAGFNGIYISTNSGDTWFLTVLPIHQFSWSSVAFSADGTKLVAVANNGYGEGIYTSTNSGENWTQSTAPANNWSCVASSADGYTLAAASSEGIFISTNSGNTWMQTDAPMEPWNFIISSADGTKLAASCIHGPGVYISTNSGADWTITLPLTGPAGIVSSADGTKLVAAYGGIPFFGTSNQVYRSTDSGLTWDSIGAPPGTNSLLLASSSADGNELVAICSSNIYLWQSTPSPRLNIKQTNSNLALSWIVPSTNLVLQQNLDLSTLIWIDVTNAPVLNFTTLQEEVMLPATNGSAFYRLATQ